MKYVVVTGGVVSGLGKGITISSIGVLLKAAGYRVTAIKVDPYLNIDAGTIAPAQHGEVFVLRDGGEVDLDLGNYERFLDVTLTQDHNLTTGKIYQFVINRERRGDYLGKTVQIVPHVTDAVQDWIERVAHLSTDGRPGPPDVCLVEIGGTVGDIESMIFLEAMRQFQFRVGLGNFCLVHVSLVPVLGADGEQKTKPTQHSVKELRTVGLSPHIIVCRSKHILDEATKNKISSFCHVSPESVLAVHDLPNVYHVPLLLEKQNISRILTDKLAFPEFRNPEMASWSRMAYEIDQPTNPSVKIAIVGKYTGMSDSYLSIVKSMTHSGFKLSRKVQIIWVEAANLDEAFRFVNPEAFESSWSDLKSADGVIVPGGFGERGFEGKVACAKYCRENKVPYLGICLGFQVAVVEYARNVLNVKGANSAEFDAASPDAFIVFMPEINPTQLGGTMRLGSRVSTLSKELENGQMTLVYQMYGKIGKVSERHRHRYEVDPARVSLLENNGLFFTGKDSSQGAIRMEFLELPRDVHPFYFGCQAHPEFQSHPNDPSPPFVTLVAAAAKSLDEYLATVEPDLFRTGEPIIQESTQKSLFPEPVVGQKRQMP